MAVNQFLFGGACLGIIVLVVVITKENDTDVEMTGEEGGGPPADAPRIVDVAMHLDNIYGIRKQWDEMKVGLPTPIDVEGIQSGTRAINATALAMFRQRESHFDDAELKGTFDEQVAIIMRETDARLQTMKRHAKMPVKVPQHAGEDKATTTPPKKADFNDESGGSAKPIPGGPDAFNQSGDMGKLIDTYSNQNSGVKPVPKKDSGFRDAEDGLDAQENKTDGVDKRAADDDAAGGNPLSSPDTMPSHPPDAEPAKRKELGGSPVADFNSTNDPPKSSPPKKKLKVAVAEPPSHAEKVDALAAVPPHAEFNANDDVQFGIDSEATRVDGIKEALSGEEDPSAQSELERLLMVTTDDLVTKGSAQYEKIKKTLSGYYDSLKKLEQEIRENGKPRDMDRVRQYVRYVSEVKIHTSQEAILKQQVFGFAEATQERTAEILGVPKSPRTTRKTKRISGASGSPQKKGKTGGN